jgi:hypothetical protein
MLTLQGLFIQVSFEMEDHHHGCTLRKKYARGGGETPREASQVRWPAVTTFLPKLRCRFPRRACGRPRPSFLPVIRVFNQAFFSLDQGGAYVQT